MQGLRVHLIGVSGSGMGALASLLRQSGAEVSGSDTAFEPPVGPMLAACGVRCLSGYSAEHLEPPPDLVVVGNAIRRGNPEAEAAERRGLVRASMSETLREKFLGKRRPLVVAGTHGKTTTSAMCAWMLARAGYEPGWFIGGVPKDFPVAAAGSDLVRPGRGRTPFVVEGDEYDAVYWRKRPKFLDYVGVGSDDVAIVTSMEHDHVDIYPDALSYEAAFRDFVRAVPSGGLLVCDGQASPELQALVAKEAAARVSWYALEGSAAEGVTAHWVGALAAPLGDGQQAFDLFAGGVACGRFSLRVPGRHNVRNAVAAIGACAEAFGLTMRDARAHLASFAGVRRRQELLGQPGGVRVYDDFAHHPTAVEETLRALRTRHPGGAMWAVFEPRSATACRSLHQQAYARAFDAADHVLLAPAARTNIPAGERLDVDRLAREIGPGAHAMADAPAIVAYLAAHARRGDTAVILSNGAFDGIHGRLLAALGNVDG
jgi:UDP-N-acetylmuramate: L-alanyl-gamma-D-glutamyl-meso-diaminopimelate ligase